MGFTSGTAATTDADLLKYFFEQQVDKLLTSGNSYTNLHLGVLDEHIAWLRGERGVDDASQITNTTDHKPLLVAMVLEKLFAGLAPRGDAADKASYYAQKVADLRRSLPIVTAAGTRTRRGLPVLVQTDWGTRFPAPGRCRGEQVAASEIAAFDDRVIEGV